MIRCRDVYRVADDYLERDLSLWQRWRINAHLRVCSACRNYLDQLRRTIAFLRARPPAPPEREVEDRLIAQIPAAAADGLSSSRRPP